MLQALSIRDVVLIERLELSFGPGLGVLTGETGAGKSILLDALGLALGARAEARLVRHGADQAVVSATFNTSPAVTAFLSEHGLPQEDDVLILRRVLNNQGKSRAFINDQAVSVNLLKSLGDDLVEIHGQFESQRLLSPANHRGLLDAYGGLVGDCEKVAGLWRGWRDTVQALDDEQEKQAAARRDEEFLRHAVAELDTLDPKAGEDAELAATRTMMMHGEKLIDAIAQALAGLTAGDGAEAALRTAMRHLEPVAGKAEGRLDSAIETLQRAALEASDGLALLEKASADLDLDPARLEAIEERLFALRALARKHDTPVDDLAALRDNLKGQLAGLEDGEAALKLLIAAEAAARKSYSTAAEKLSAKRAKAAKRLDKAVDVELPPLKMEKARFFTRLERLEPTAWGPNGCDSVVFEVATNPGSPPGPLNRIASGGELSRFMLALKAVLADADPVGSLIFDEVDSGIGGAVAAAVGDRLAALAEQAQVLVVTHSPQVAARGSHHLRVSKTGNGGAVSTTVEILKPDERKEEIARMLAGAEVTNEARAAADSLLQGAG